MTAAVSFIRRLIPALLRVCIILAGSGQAALADEMGAREIVAQAAAALRVEELIARGGLLLEAHGTRDLTVVRQGLQLSRPERTPLVTRLAVDPAAHAVAFETRGWVNPDAEEHLRFVFQRDADTLLIDYINGRAFHIGPDDDVHAERYLATIPHLLLRGLLAPGSTAARPTLAKVEDSSRTDAVAIASRWEDGRAVTLLLDRETHFVTEVRTRLDLAVDGQVTLAWTYGPYIEVDGIPFPVGHTLSWRDRTYETLEYRSVTLRRPAAPEFAPPDWIAPPPPSPAPDATRAAPPPATARPSPLREIRPGVYLFANARGGFHPLVVAQSDGLLVVDAPAAWHELSELPPSRSEPGDDSASVGQRLLADLAELLPDQPVRRLLLTHAHGDHMGGALPFVDAGVEVLASPATRVALEAMLGRQGRRADAADVRTVSGRLSLEDAARPVDLVDVGANPHSEGMIVVYLPNERVLYQADLFEPLSPPDFPAGARLSAAQWFVRWLDRSGLAVDEAFAMHGSARVTDEQLAAIRTTTAAHTTVAVVGATGNQGGAVARELLRRGMRVRALTRNPEGSRARALAEAGADVVRADLDDPESLRAAFGGAHAVYGMTDFWEHGREREVDHGRNQIAAARAANVRHFVFGSVASADRDTGLAHFQSKREIEGILRESGLPFTILRPVSFMENWSDARTSLADGEWIDPQSSDARQQLVSVRDLARFAADAIERPDAWFGVTMELAGDELTVGEMAAVAGRILGRKVRHRRVSWREAHRTLGPEMADMLRWFERTGYDVDVAALRAAHPWLTRFEDYLAGLPQERDEAPPPTPAGEATALIERMSAAMSRPGGAPAPVVQLEWRGTTLHPFDSHRSEAPWDAGRLWQGQIVDFEQEAAIVKQVAGGNGTRSVTARLVAPGRTASWFNALAGGQRSLDTASFDDILDEYAAYSPWLALVAMNRHPERVRVAAHRTCRGDRLQTLAYRRAEGSDVFLLADPVTHRIVCADHHDVDYDGSIIPLRVEHREDWVEHGGLAHPAGYTEYARGEPVRAMALVHVETGTAPLAAPATVEGYRYWDPEPAELREFQARELAPGVWFVGEGVMYQLFIEFDEFLVAVDGVSGDVERRIEAVAARVPGKPIRYLVITHPHADHLHGVRAFAARGATILASGPHEAAVRRQIGEGFAARLQSIAGRFTVEDGGRRLEILDIGPTPHSAHLLAAYLPRERLLYEADLMVVSRWEPVPPASGNARALDAAIDRLRLDVATIVGPHAPVVASREQLAESVSRAAARRAPLPLPYDERWRTDPALAW